MATFDDMLADLHGGAALQDNVTDSENIVVINTATRTFEYPEKFNKVIACEGDVNSQIITFAVPVVYEGHRLASCGHKIIKWKSKESEGVCDLAFAEEVLPEKLSSTHMGLSWIVPPEAFTKAGTIEISIAFYDLDDNNKIGFSWNTTTDSSLTVLPSHQKVGTILKVDIDDEEPITLPSESEILVIDVDNRRIVAPAGYNYTFANYGDIGTSCIYFETDRYIKGIDLLANNVLITATIQFSGQTYSSSNLTRVDCYAEESKGKGKVLISWLVDSGITNNVLSYTGAITISLIIKELQTGVEKPQVLKAWNTTPFQGLIIGKTLSNSSILVPTENSYFYTLEGDSVDISRPREALQGLVGLRTWQEGIEKVINNELIVKYNEGNFSNLALWTDDGLVDLRSAIYNQNNNLTSGTPIELNEVATKEYVDSTTGTIENLFYNPYFEVNQYGFSSINSTETKQPIENVSSFYVADRWRLYGRPVAQETLPWTPTEIARNDKNQIVIDNSSNEYRVILLQSFDQKMLKHLLDRDLTLACGLEVPKTQDGEVVYNYEEHFITFKIDSKLLALLDYDKTGIPTGTDAEGNTTYTKEYQWNEEDPSNYFCKYTYINSEGKSVTENLRLRVYTGTASTGDKAVVNFQLFIPGYAPKIIIHWMSLAEGTIAVKPQRPDPLLELKRCQQFYQLLPGMRVAPSWIGGSVADFFIPLKVEMRRKPNVLINLKTSGGYPLLDRVQSSVIKIEYDTSLAYAEEMKELEELNKKEGELTEEEQQRKTVLESIKNEITKENNSNFIEAQRLLYWMSYTQVDEYTQQSKQFWWHTALTADRIRGYDGSESVGGKLGPSSGGDMGNIKFHQSYSALEECPSQLQIQFIGRTRKNSENKDITSWPTLPAEQPTVHEGLVRTYQTALSIVKGAVELVAEV